MIRIGSRRLAACIGGVLAAAVLMGCGPSADTQQLQSTDYQLRGMIANQGQRIDALQEQFGRLNNQVEEMQHNGAGGGGPSVSKQIASLQNRVTQLEAEMKALQPAGTASPIPGAAASPAPGAVTTPAAGPGPAAETGGGEMMAAAPTPSAMPTPVAPSGATGSWRTVLQREEQAARTSGDPGATLYREGLADMGAGRYPSAVGKFEELQHKYPKSPLSEPAEYFSANALYELGKYDLSILQFNDLAMRFPNGRFASSALLHEAQAFMKINDRIDARLTLQKLLNEHPDSPEAPSAKALMQTLAG